MSGVIRDLHFNFKIRIFYVFSRLQIGKNRVFNFKISPETSISRLTTPIPKLIGRVSRDSNGEGACIGKGFWV